MPSHEIRPADRRDQDVGAPAVRRQIVRARMRDRSPCSLVYQQLRHRLADDVRAADHHGARPASSPERGRAGSGSRAACRARGRSPSGRQPPDIDRVKAVDVLRRIDRLRARPCASMCAGNGSCTRMPCTAGSALSSPISASSSASLVCSRQMVVDRHDARGARPGGTCSSHRPGSPGWRRPARPRDRARCPRPPAADALRRRPARAGLQRARYRR